MRRKTILALIVLAVIAILLLYQDRVSTKGIQEIAENTPGYECGLDQPCTLCMVRGELCDCGTKVCRCGTHTVNRSVCYPSREELSR